jgi:hypothetical protein
VKPVVTDASTVEVFVNEAGGVDSIALVLVNPSIVEYEDRELSPACALTPWQARCLAHALTEKANEIDSQGDLQDS